MLDFCFVLAATAVALTVFWVIIPAALHPRRSLLSAEKALGFFQRLISAHKRSSIIFVATLLTLTAANYYELQRQIGEAMSTHTQLMSSLYELAIVFSPDGGYAHPSKSDIDKRFAEFDPINNLHLNDVMRSKWGSVDAKTMAQDGFLPGDSDEIARENMDEARRRIQIAKASDDINDPEDYNCIEDDLLGLSYDATIRPTIIQYLLWKVGLKQKLFEQYPVRRD